MKKNWLLLGALLMSVSLTSVADDFEDDIYFNPSKQKTAAKKKAASNYIANFDQQDVDSYNRRGQYYATPIDTIGDYVASGEDFVYTQKIQKFYNPTIVIDNADLLQTVLDNSYGNVEIIYDIDGPVFSSIYSPWSGYLPASWYSPYYYPNTWGWTVGWNSPYWYGPSWSWSWNFGPAWGPSWSWGWGPSWSYGPGWGWGGGWRPPHYHHPVGRPYAQWTPGRNSVNRPGSYYGGGYTYNGNHGIGRPGHTVGRPGITGSTRPGTSTSRPGSTIGRPTTSRPAGSAIGGTRGSTRPGTTSTTRPTTSTTRPSTSTTRPSSSTTRPGSSSTSTSSGRGSSNKSTSVSRPSSSSSNRGSSVSRPSSGSNRGSSAGRSSGGARPSGGRGGRR